MSPRPVRIPAQVPDEWSESTRAELGAVVSPGGGLRPVHLPAVVAQHPRFLPPYLAWAKAIALHGVLPPRDNALLALRTACNCGSEFEWGVHAASAPARAGLTADEIARVAAGPGAPGWSAGESALLRAADELAADHSVAAETWAVLSAHYAPAALLEIAFVVGHYTMLSMVANTAGVPTEPDWLPLPE